MTRINPLNTMHNFTNKSQKHEPLYGEKELARLIGISQSSISDALRNGKLPVPDFYIKSGMYKTESPRWKWSTIKQIIAKKDELFPIAAKRNNQKERAEK